MSNSIVKSIPIDKMNLLFHGGAGEVGRSCISVDDRYLFDAGLKISEEGSEYPMLFDARRIKAVFLSHAHLDHNGALPLLNHRGLNCPVFCNSMTRDLSKIMLSDSFHVEKLENQSPGYSRENIYNVLALMQNTVYDREYRHDGLKFRFLYAGHIPGSASVLIEYKGKRILYTGDINTSETHLLKGAGKFPKDVDVMICESTYGDRNHPPRKSAEEAFTGMVRKTIDRGGTALIPAFAVGRSQEVLMILAKSRWDVPVYLDGMSKQVSALFLKRAEFLKDRTGLQAALKDVRFVKKPRERKEIIKEQAIIVTTSGMLDGGPVIDYLGSLYFDARSSVLMTGYQAEETNGRLLQEQGKVYIDGIRLKVKGTVKKYDFSAHSGRKELIRLIERIRPKKLVFVHGDRPSSESLAAHFRDKADVYTPKTGDTIGI